MRNLCINSKITLEFQGEPSKFALSDDGPISYKSGKLWLHSISEVETTEIIDLQQTFEQEGTKLENETCSDISYFSDGRIIISFDSGLLISIDINLKSIEVIGSFPTGLSGLWKSPDDELLVLTAKDNAVILMTAGDYEPLLEFNPDQATNEAFANVNVGWGAKATQFHGKAGKAAREVSQEAPEEAFESDLKVVWRDDGLYFAVSFVGNDKIRRVRVFNRQGQLQSTSENVKSLGTSLAWKPNGGALIASSMKLPNGKDVIGFLEKNGLRHGEFQLDNPCKVHDLKWNCDASILALHITTETNQDLIQLWTVSNYKWQLKKTFSASKKFLGFLWDTVSAMTLFTFEAEKCTQIELKFKIHKSSGYLSYIAVIDGKTCKVTPFTEMVVPPPISAFELHFPVNIEDIVFVEDNLTVITEDTVYAFTPGASSNDDQALVKITGAGGSGFVPKCTTLSLNKKCQSANAGLYNWNGHMEYLVAYNQATISIMSKNGDDKKDIICEDTIHDIIPYASGFYVILVDGTLLTLKNLEVEVESWCLKPKCTQIEAYGSDWIVSLNERNQRLYLNDTEIATGVTSFFIHSNFLLVTTVKHTLKSLPLDQLVNCQNENIWSQESVRALERGSKLVISVSNDTKTILQMPRGNLEVIHPRALAIHILKQFLDACQYSKAMEMLRKQRINLNLLVDHNPGLFMKNIKGFLEQVPNMDRLCVFIADLANENVTKTMYASSYPTSTTENPQKVDEICQLLLQTMEDKEKFILPIISCHVKSSRSSLDEALLQIQGLPPKLKEEALNFLLLLVNVNQLFDVALGLYDFDLVLYVAERSQKDPKEYFPFLNELKKCEENYRKYKINLHLKRYEKALECLAKNEEYLNEALELVKNQRLYNQALKLYQIGSKSYIEMCRIYGDYLITKKYFEDAALIYEAANLNLEAINAWEQSENWNFCLSLAQEHIKIPAEMANLCSRLVEKLKDSHRHAEAANILMEYLNDPEEALVVLLQGQVWNEAIRLIYKHNRMDLYETNLKPALIEASNELIGQLDKKLSTFQGYVNRFQEVVKMKEKLAEGNYEETDINIEDADMYSDVTSLKSGISKVKSKPGSIKTRVSKKSSRSRKKEEMKKYSTKEGSKYEDLGLMAAIHDLMILTYKNTYNEVSQILRALVKFKFFEQAQTIQAKMEQLDHEFKVSETLIWNPRWNENSQEALKFGPEATTEDIINRASSGYKPEFSILEAKFRFAPVKPANCNDWKLQILMK